MVQRNINPWTWQDQYGFVQAVEVSDVRRVIMISGQASVDTAGQPLHPEDMTTQLQQALDNLETVLVEAGLDLSAVVRLNYYTTDVDRFYAAATAVRGRLEEANCQAASTVLGVLRLGHPELLVVVEATAVR